MRLYRSQMLHGRCVVVLWSRSVSSGGSGRQERTMNTGMDLLIFEEEKDKGFDI